MINLQMNWFKTELNENQIQVLMINVTKKRSI